MCSGRTLYVFSVLASALMGCSGGGVPPAARPVAAPSATAAVISTAPSTPESLPPHFTLELTPTGQLFADGTPVVNDEDLMRRARVAAGELSEAALLGDPGAQGLRLAALFDVLLRAGFSHVRFAGRRAASPVATPAALSAPLTAPPPLATANAWVQLPSASAPPVAVSPAAAPPAAAWPLAAAPPLQSAPAAAPPLQSAPALPLAPAAAVLVQPPAPAAALPEPVPSAVVLPLPAPELPPARSVPSNGVAASVPSTAARSAPAASFSVQTVGLRVIGDERDEPNRQRLVQLFEQSFPSFRRCYPLAHNSGINATFGIDLYVAKGGGPGKVQQVRSRLSGAEFRECMEQAFRKIRFKPPKKGVAVIVSYSLLFKPASG